MGALITRAVSSRRSFIRTASAAVSVPLAAVAATLPVATETDPLATRLGLLEDENAIRALNQAYARHVNAGADEAIVALFADGSGVHVDPGIRSLAADGFGEHDVIEIVADRQTATGVIHCTVQFESPIGPTCTLVDMAREQGGGVVTRIEKGVFENVYAKRDGVWKIQHSTYRPA